MERFEDFFSQECSNDDLALTLIFYGKTKFADRALIWEAFMDLVEDFVQKLINTVK